MDLRELTAKDREAAVRLWGDAGLTRPWNDPVADFDRALAAAKSAVVGLFDDGLLAGAVMVGDDGHRGWVHYLAVDVMHRRRGAGAELMAAAENWMISCGVAKVNLMVRHSKPGGSRLLREPRVRRRRRHGPLASALRISAVGALIRRSGDTLSCSDGYTPPRDRSAVANSAAHE